MRKELNAYETPRLHTISGQAKGDLSDTEAARICATSPRKLVRWKQGALFDATLRAPGRAGIKGRPAAWRERVVVSLVRIIYDARAKGRRYGTTRCFVRLIAWMMPVARRQPHGRICTFSCAVPIRYVERNLAHMKHQVIAASFIHSDTEAARNGRVDHADTRRGHWYWAQPYLHGDPFARFAVLRDQGEKVRK